MTLAALDGALKRCLWPNCPADGHRDILSKTLFYPLICFFHIVLLLLFHSAFRCINFTMCWHDSIQSRVWTRGGSFTPALLSFSLSLFLRPHAQRRNIEASWVFSSVKLLSLCRALKPKPGHISSVLLPFSLFQFGTVLSTSGHHQPPRLPSLSLTHTSFTHTDTRLSLLFLSPLHVSTLSGNNRCFPDTL